MQSLPISLSLFHPLYPASLLSASSSALPQLFLLVLTYIIFFSGDPLLHHISLPPTQSPFLLFLSSVPPPLFPPLHLCMASSPLHGGQALLSPSPPQEPLTSAGCCAKVVPLSLPAGSGSFVPRMFKHRSVKRKHCDINNTAFKMAETYA